MCFLKITSKEKSFKDLSKVTLLPIYSIYDKGEKRNKTDVYNEFRISFDVSDKEWDDFPGQVQDAINYLQHNFMVIQKILIEYNVSDRFLDFPIYSRLNDNIVNQNDYLPKELVILAGKLGLGIEMSIYSKNAFEEKNE